MRRELFGTDGIRGLANREPVTADTALKVAMAAARRYGDRARGRPLAVIAKDTRLSGEMLESALTAGLTAAGMDAALLGPLPTPAVAMLTPALGADLGIMISASHNPYADNGIKLFGADGYKLDDAEEAALEGDLRDGVADARAGSDALGRAWRMDDGPDRYVAFAKGSCASGLRLNGLTVVVDCAHGAAYRVAPRVLRELGAEVVTVAADPDGFNINAACGATAPAAMQEAVAAYGAHLGLAFDGDGDRLVVADERGKLVGGDQVLAGIAATLHRQGRLTGGGLGTTTMANMNLAHYLADLGLGMTRTAVGDRYVLERMRADGVNLGGEPSGHIIMTDYTTTGDALIAALQVLSQVVGAGAPASAGLHAFDAAPQVREDVRVNDRGVVETERVRAAAAHAEHRLHGRGRLILRPSGTEPLVRVMVEGQDRGELTAVAAELAAVIREADAGEEVNA